MSSAIIIFLLQAAITLLTLVQTNPALPQSTRDSVMQVVQQSITMATAALSTNTQTTGTSCPTYNIPSCPVGQRVQSGTVDATGCTGAPRCVNNVTACPVVDPVQCSNGTLVSLATDTNGCNKGYQCVAPNINSSVTITTGYGDTVIHASESDPLIQGTASVGTSIRVVVTNQSGRTAYDSGLFDVKGQWSTRVNPPIPFGNYTVTVYSADNQVLTTAPLQILGL